MAQFRVAIIGCGGRGRAHALGYQASPEVEVVACADPLRENAEKLAEEFVIPHIYEDYQQMLEEQKPDIVSICTWTALHYPMVMNAVSAGAKAIHCEKPMAPTWGEAKQMHQVCEEAGVLLTFCHQRRFAPSFVKARELLQQGAIGEVYRLEGYCPNLFDWGTHWFDMFLFYNNEIPGEWVMGQIDCSQEKEVFGVPIETYGLSYIKFRNGVYGLMVTGQDGGGRCQNRILGTEGILEIRHSEGSGLFLFDRKQGWREVDLQGVVPAGGATTLSLLNLIEGLKTGQEPELSSRKALQATELIFATYESARRRVRVYLPLEIEDSPLISILREIGRG